VAVVEAKAIPEPLILPALPCPEMAHRTCLINQAVGVSSKSAQVSLRRP
jgi:hypothetical protein